LGVIHALLSWLRALRTSYRAPPAWANVMREVLVHTLDWSLAQADAIGSLPSHVDGALNGEPSKLVHFCHGLPGATLVYCLAAKELNVDRFRAATVRFGEVTHEWDLLRKSPGLAMASAGTAL